MNRYREMIVKRKYSYRDKWGFVVRDKCAVSAKQNQRIKHSGYKNCLKHHFNTKCQFSSLRSHKEVKNDRPGQKIMCFLQ